MLIAKKSHAPTAQQFAGASGARAPRSLPGLLASLWPAERRRIDDRFAIGGRLKRAMDIAIASTALVLLAPLMATIAALILIRMGRPVIFTQQRVGLNGRPFTFFKFRSMCRNSDEVLRRHLANDLAAAAEWRDKQKLMRDPRVGRLGNFLRKSSLDELPQLFNVLRGDMSLVGPRPVVLSEIARYGHHARKCFRARPGLTGMWQVSGRNRLSYRARVALDRYYATHWSIGLDVILLFRTIPALTQVADTA
jgi:lipopolysaccharide/colanic/teichoic acid biosynthesis glycosyltransferase